MLGAYGWRHACVRPLNPIVSRLMNRTLLSLSLWSVAAVALFSACSKPQGLARTNQEATPGVAQLLPHDVRDLQPQVPAEESLLDLVRASVPGEYSAEMQQGQLFVRGTPSVHEAINLYLTDLRAQYAAN